MPTTRSILWLVALAMLTACLPRTVRAQSASEREYQLKAAFLYNFVLFIDGPRFDQLRETSEEEARDPNKPVTIGIIGKDPFGNAFAPLLGKEIRNRAVVIKRFKGYSEVIDPNDPNIPQHPQFNDIKECYVLFVCSSEEPYLDITLKTLGKYAMLTVADTPEFLEAGGMINFVIDDKKVRFEINTAATDRAQLRIRSKLLRLAKRVIKRDSLSVRDSKEDEVENGAK